MASKRSPLTRRQLRQIGLENKTPAVRDLLWEIQRLRTIVLQAEQLEARLRDVDVIAGLERIPQITWGY